MSYDKVVVIIANIIGDEKFNYLIGKYGTIVKECEENQSFMVIIDGNEYICDKSEIEIVE